MEQRLWDTVTRLAPLQPEFVSVTYGAGGSTRERTARTVARILKETDIKPAAHLTCVDATREEVDRVVREFAALGVNRFVALRGDPAAGIGEKYVPTPGGYQNGAELVGGLRNIADFDISVSAYPEKHPESPDFATDIDMLKRKVDNGATRAITQFFFENDLYERYVERVRRAGIYIPIVPGVLPVHNFKQVKISARGRRPIFQVGWRNVSTDWTMIRRRIAGCSRAIAAEQVMDLIERGVQDFHFYTMNRADLPFAICHMIGIRPKTEAALEVA